MTHAIASLALAALMVCAPAPVRVLEWCGLPGVRCLDIEAKDPDVEVVKLSWCCGYDGTPCTLVAGISACDPEAEYAVVCDWGRTMPDGSIECYE